MLKERLAIYGGEPVRKKKMPPRKAFGENEHKALIEAAEYYLKDEKDPPYQGTFEVEFCRVFSDFQGGGFADAVASGTAAIFVALAALDLTPGSDVIIAPVTDSGPLNCIIFQGFTPVVADSMPDSYNMGVEQFLARMTPKTSAVIAVHLAGEPLEIDRLVEEAYRRGIRVLEDSSQAPGAVWKGRKVGTFGEIAAFSTMYRKTLTAGASSGIVYTKDQDLYHRALAHADRGKQSWRTDLNQNDPSQSLFPALNFNTDELSCAIGLSSLRRLQQAVDRRVAFLEELVAALPKVSRACRPYNFHRGFSPFFFPIFVDESVLNCTKTEFARAVAAEGIDLLPHYGCVVSSWPWARPYLSDDFDTPNARSTRDRSFNLFLNERYGSEEVRDIVAAIEKVERYYLKQ